MARPTTKSELIKVAGDQYEKMWSLINSLSEENQNKEFAFEITEKDKEAHWKRDKNVRDVFIHLYEWHKLLLDWVENNQKGISKQFLAEGYNWKTYGDMNIEFWKKHQNTSYEEAKMLIQKSHKAVIDLIDTFTNEELFEKGVFNWVGGSTLGQYCVSATSSHYDWAMKKIKKHSASCNN